MVGTWAAGAGSRTAIWVIWKESTSTPPGDPKAVKASGEIIEDGCQAAIEEAMGIPIAAFGSVMNERFGPACRNYPKYMGKIKKALDPDTVSDPFFYAEPDDGPSTSNRS
jgi:hypothetical protein